MKYGYARMTANDEVLQSQLDQLNKEGCTKIYKDMSGKIKRDRPEFNKVLEVLKENDTLVITKLDRFALSTQDAVSIIKKLFESGVKVHVLNMGVVEDTPTGKIIFSTMLAFAELEKDLLAEHIQERKEIVRLDLDFKAGRPRMYSRKQINHAIKLKETKTYGQVEDLTGISKSTLIRSRRRKGLDRKGLI